MAEKTTENPMNALMGVMRIMIFAVLLIVLALKAAEHGWIPDLLASALALLLPFAGIGLSVRHLWRSAKRD